MRSNFNSIIHRALVLAAGVSVVSFAPAADAATRLWSTYYGGNSFERASAVQFDGDDNIVVAGNTSSGVDVTGNVAGFVAHDTSFNGVNDGFVARFDFYGVRQWGTYFGGAAEDYFLALGTDSNDSVVAVGMSKSAGIATAGVAQTTRNGTQDALVAKFWPSGALWWATYLGGSGIDTATGVCIGSTGTIYVVGTRDVSGVINGFVAKLTSDGANLLWTTHLGGATGTTIPRGCVVDSSHNVYVVGETNVSGLGLGISVHDATYNAATDAFLAKFTTNGVQSWGTYFGGTSQDKGNAIAIDDASNLYIAGLTRSSSGIASPGASSGSLVDVEDAFVAKFNSNGARQWGTYFGGVAAPGEVNWEYISGIAYNEGLLYLSGSTNSAAIATVDGHDQTYGGYQDAMFMTMDASDSDVLYATYVGGTGSSPSDQGLAVAATFAHGVIVGSTSSTGSMTSVGAHDVFYGGGIDAYITLFEMFAT